MDDEQMVKANKDFLVTETMVDPKIAPNSIIEWLRGRKVTGQLIFNLSQGGVQSVELTERTRALDGQRQKVREALGV